MVARESFHSLAPRQWPRGTRGDNDVAFLPELLADAVTQPFERMTGMQAVVVPLRAHDDAGDDPITPLPLHPQCAPECTRAHCRACIRAHLATMTQTYATTWHQCKRGRYCAMVPVVTANRCVAVARLVCGEEIGAHAFLGHTELLGVLVENFAHQAESSALPPQDTPPLVCDGQAVDAFTAPSDSHPQIARALGYIASHLADTGLSVCSVARSVGSHPDYLAHLFAAQMGKRMSRYITEVRIARAGQLLTATNRQIKQVAWDVGFANPNWFSHVFRRCTGMTPSAYRRQTRPAQASQRALPD